MASNLPDYVASAQPVPQANRIPWYKSTAQTYAGIMLWFVFWQDIPVGDKITPELGFSATAGGMLAQGLGFALLGLVLAALLCHFFYYLVPGLLGMKTGLPLYIVGTSTYGTLGGFLMPGFLMGLLQFGWLSVNAFFSAWLLVIPFQGLLQLSPDTVATLHKVVAVVWAVAAAFMGVKGIKYVASVASFLPLIPLAILVALFFMTVGGLADFDPEVVVELGAREAPLGEGEFLPAPSPALAPWQVVAVILTYVIGFFATAGAAGTDFGMNNRDRRDVQLGGLMGITLATIFAGGLSLLIVAGAYGMGAVGVDEPVMQTTALMDVIIDPKLAGFFSWALAVAAFPPACFASFIAANSFKTTLPKVPPFISVGIGTLAAIFLAVTGLAGDVINVFVIIGASFGPICGAMAADYILSGMKWAGPRAAFNPAGWISWLVGFVVGVASFIPPLVGRLTQSMDPTPRVAETVSEIAGWVPVPPLSAFVVGFVLYYLLAKLRLESRVLEMPAMAGEQAAEAPAPEPPAEEPTAEPPAEEKDKSEGDATA